MLLGGVARMGRKFVSGNKAKIIGGVTFGSLLLTAWVSPQKAYFYSDNILKKAQALIASKLDEMKRKHGDQIMTFPQVNYSFQGGNYKIDYLVDQRKCDIFSLLVTAASIIQENEGRAKNNPKPFVTIKTIQNDNVMSFKLEFNEEGEHGIKQKGVISITGEFTADRPSFRFVLEKQSDITDVDIRIIAETYQRANLTTSYSTERAKNQFANKQTQHTSTKDEGFFSRVADNFSGNNKENKEIASDEPLSKLKEMGVIVFLPEAKNYLEGLSWDVLAGYESQKRDIEDTVLLSLTHANIFDEITSKTRARFEKNRAKAVLFEGPPGTGKTTSAKIIASQVGIPLLYLPLESVMSKWYGESEKKLADIFELAGKLGRAIIFIDEVDALALSRSDESHEVSRRILSTLLRKIDSFESDNDTLLICATNRKQDLDRAILSRIDLSIKFDLPDVHSRKEIFRRYAMHLDDQMLSELASMSTGQSGRNIYELCKDAERRWASKRIRKEVEEPLPPFNQYIESLHHRIKSDLS